MNALRHVVAQPPRLKKKHACKGASDCQVARDAARLRSNAARMQTRVNAFVGHGSTNASRQACKSEKHSNLFAIEAAQIAMTCHCALVYACLQKLA